MRSSSRDFKKKSKPPSLLPQKGSSSKNLIDLKTKLQTQKQIMKNTGKRFRESQTTIQLQQSSTDKQQYNDKQFSKTKQQISKQTKSIISSSSKKSISLSQISDHTNSIDLSASQNFKQYGWKKQEKNIELRDLLQSIKLLKYQDDLIEAGFDDVDTLLQIDTETLNDIKMKASHQRNLYNEIKKIKDRKGQHQIGISTQPMRESTMSSITSRNRPKTELSMYSETQSLNKTEIVFTKLYKSTLPTKPALSTQNSFLKTSSTFLYNAGGRNFDLIVKQVNNLERKACCTCFTLTYTPLRYGNYSYCSQKCIQEQKSKLKKTNTSRVTSTSFIKKSPSKPKNVSKERKLSKEKEVEDVLSSLSHISLSSSFIRQYK